jgi:nucleoporin SEH1
MVSPGEKIDLAEESFVTCLAFNYFGDRLAIGTEDQTIQIWEMNQNREWTKTYAWQAHNGAVIRVRWAHPEFGNILASCSFDKSVIVWEEKPEDCTWNSVTKLVESKGPVEDIRFAPKHLGLQLASCSENGEIRIYETTDMINLKVWIVNQIIQASSLGSTSISWNPSLNDSPMLVIGNNDQATAQAKFSKAFTDEVELIQLWSYSEENKEWVKRDVGRGHDATVTDVDWSPVIGRQYHLIASCSLDRKVIIWRVDDDFCLTAAHTLSGHSERVWRVCWDMFGTSLSSTSEDGVVIVWQRNLMKEWEIVKKIR